MHAATQTWILSFSLRIPGIALPCCKSFRWHFGTCPLLPLRQRDADKILQEWAHTKGTTELPVYRGFYCSLKKLLCKKRKKSRQCSLESNCMSPHTRNSSRSGATFHRKWEKTEEIPSRSTGLRPAHLALQAASMSPPLLKNPQELQPCQLIRASVNPTP